VRVASHICGLIISFEFLLSGFGLRISGFDLGLAFSRPVWQNGSVNTASQNLVHHLVQLQKKLQHATDYELALTYFLEEFAGDKQFIDQCQPQEALPMLALLGRVAARAVGRPVRIEDFHALRLPQFGFVHGSAQAGGRIVLFFYFEALDTGLMALTPGLKGGTEVARFRLEASPGGNPSNN
jgi:hypothetical protein